MKKTYKIYTNNVSWTVKDCYQTLIHEQRKSCARIGVLKGKKKVAIFSFGKQVT